jgi:hypothetical protein
MNYINIICSDRYRIRELESKIDNYIEYIEKYLITAGADAVVVSIQADNKSLLSTSTRLICIRLEPTILGVKFKPTLLYAPGTTLNVDSGRNLTFKINR